MHVQPETRTVYRALAGYSHTRTKLTEWAAYYDAAKRLVVDKYPSFHDVIDSESALNPHLREDLGTDSVAESSRVAARRRELFFCRGCWIDDGYHCDGNHFDAERWKAFVSRVARFLRFVDRRRAELEEASKSAERLRRIAGGRVGE